jgi:hypothetical protein
LHSTLFPLSPPLATDSRSELSRLQRAQIYALNELMTTQELQMFEDFMRQSALRDSPLASGSDSSFESDGDA